MFVFFFKMISQHPFENTELYLTYKPNTLRGFFNFRFLNFQVLKIYRNIQFLRIRQIFALISSVNFDFLILNRNATQILNTVHLRLLMWTGQIWIKRLGF
jgi:hypothetical protein